MYSGKVSPPASTSKKAPISFRDTCLPILWLNRILSMVVIEVPEGRPWLTLSIIYATAKWVGYGYLLWYTVKNDESRINSIPIMAAVFQVILYVNVVIAVLSTYLGLANYKKYELYFKKIELADETLEIFGIDPEYSSGFKDYMKITAIWSLGGALVCATDFAIACYTFSSVPYAIIRILVFEIPMVLNPMVELNFSLMINAIGTRFERLNALIQSVAVTPLQSMNSRNFDKYQNILNRNQSKIAVKPNYYYYKNRNNIELLLRTARQLHLDLCATAREVNDVCSRQMSMQMAAKFLLITGFAYCLYLIYNDPNIPLSGKLQHYVSLGAWIVINIARMIFVVRTSVNAQKTSQIAHEIQVSKSQSNLIDEIHQLSLQIMQHPLFFTASGLLVLDFGYVRGFVGSVTTYLMILIQNQSDMLKAATTLANPNNDTSATTPSP
ncbi:gustatory receptor 49 [Nasonia vitripennis]|uniref:Gustatory receptor n=1 Tax=Nasonia vitripennis TaxID=7425 RepID=A0A7M6W8H9_NASVI|nr:gustatory receptor 49 [Nasonia vitripennis]